VGLRISSLMLATNNTLDRCTKTAPKIQVAIFMVQAFQILKILDRHNGVIIDLPEPEKRDGMDEDVMSGSKSPSRSASPPGRKNENVAHHTNPTALSQPGTAGPTAGPSSYYRQHTSNAHGTFDVNYLLSYVPTVS
jgi:hypothetical protein